MPLKSSQNKDFRDFNLVSQLCDVNGNPVTWVNPIEIMPRYTDNSTAVSKTFSAIGDYNDPSYHNNVGGTGWSYDFEMVQMPPTPGAWYNYTYDTNSGRRSGPTNATSLNDHGTLMSLYMDIHIGDGPHPGVGTNYAHIALLTQQYGAHHQYYYSGATPDYTQARTIFDHTSGNQNIKIAGQNYGSRLYSQIFCMAEMQSNSYSGGRFLRLINWGGGPSNKSRVTVTGGQLIIHGRSGNNSASDR